MIFYQYKELDKFIELLRALGSLYIGARVGASDKLIPAQSVKDLAATERVALEE